MGSIEDNNPVVFIEFRRLYEETADVPEKPYTVPLGKAAVQREGKDITIVAFSYMVLEAAQAADSLEKIGIHCEIIDPRTLKPLDSETILNSVRKTGRLAVADTGWKTCGMAAEVSALAAEHAFSSLRAPIRRVTLPDIPTPSSYSLEKYYYPGASDIVRAVGELLGKPLEVIEALLKKQDERPLQDGSAFYS